MERRNSSTWLRTQARTAAARSAQTSHLVSSRRSLPLLRTRPALGISRLQLGLAHPALVHPGPAQLRLLQLRQLPLRLRRLQALLELLTKPLGTGECCPSQYWSATLGQLNAHCGNPAHRRGTLRCKMDRALQAGGKRRALVGLLVAWASCPCDSKEDHDRSKKDLCGEAVQPVRQEGRELLAATAAHDDARGRLAREIVDADGFRAGPAVCR